MSPEVQARDVVCLSLEPWDEVWRRNQHVASGLLGLRPHLRVLFVESPIDILWTLRRGAWPGSSALRTVGESGRLWAMAPRKWLPRKLAPGVDQQLGSAVLRTTRRLGFERPVLWINDAAYAGLPARTGWPTVYDVTDDWTLADGDEAQLRRERANDALLTASSDEVVVCSPGLVTSRGAQRQVHLIPNGVDIDHLRAPGARPDDLPEGRIVLYQGTLSDGRLDLDLCVALARRLTGRATLVFLGPNSLDDASTRRLLDAGAVVLGGRPYSVMPAYLQHADALVVPHRPSPFIESLDPIKAREFQAVARPVVATPVAGFRELGPPVVVAAPEEFVAAVEQVLASPPLPPGPGPLRSSPGTWAERASAFLAVLDQAAQRRGSGSGS